MNKQWLLWEDCLPSGVWPFPVWAQKGLRGVFLKHKLELLKKCLTFSVSHVVLSPFFFSFQIFWLNAASFFRLNVASFERWHSQLTSSLRKWCLALGDEGTVCHQQLQTTPTSTKESGPTSETTASSTLLWDSHAANWFVHLIQQQFWKMRNMS